VASPRTYGDRCGVAYALDLVGERWALLVVRELLLGPKRFTDLQKGLPHASRSVLAARLHELEQAGLVQRRQLPPPAGSWVYELTDWGRQLEGVVISLGRFALAGPNRSREGEMSVDSHVLHLKALFDPRAADGLEAGYELHLGEHRFRARVADGQIEFAHGPAHQPDATIETDPGTLLELVANPRGLTQAIGSGEIRIEGDRKAVTRFLRLFPRPEPAARQ
jgi:DNA-binding HxlR family transcriptional regulator/putative sterol carrier protein